jgi:L-lactate dehydrogenase complex protein LldE
LYATCIVDQLYPEVGVSVVKVLRNAGVEVDFPKNQTCCGQPVYNSGFTREGRSLATRVLQQFKESEVVVVPSASCAAMMRVFYLDLFRDDPTLLDEARALSSKVYEFSEYLVDVLGVDNLGCSYSRTATFHSSCHQLRELQVQDQPRKLLGNVEGLELRDLPQADTCCGFGGTFSVKFPHISEGMLQDKVDAVRSTGADTLVSCDMSCLMQIGGALSRQKTGISVRHLAQVLAGGQDSA